jgi:DNA replication protein DnaC
MSVEQTLRKLCEIRLESMAEAYREQLKDPGCINMDFDDRLAQLVDRHWLNQTNKAIDRRLKNARLKLNSSVENIDYHTQRGLNKNVFKELIRLEWIRYHQNCVITGPTGVGKSYLACALAQKACREGYKALYKQSMKLFRELLAAKTDGSLSKLLLKTAKYDLLIIDDFGLESARKGQYRDFLELIDELWNNGAVIISSQIPIDKWHDFIDEPTVADAIVDRIFHNAYFINLKGESMRKKRTES